MIPLVRSPSHWGTSVSDGKGVASSSLSRNSAKLVKMEMHILKKAVLWIPGKIRVYPTVFVILPKLIPNLQVHNLPLQPVGQESKSNMDTQESLESGAWSDSKKVQKI